MSTDGFWHNGKTRAQAYDTISSQLNSAAQREAFAHEEAQRQAREAEEQKRRRAEALAAQSEEKLCTRCGAMTLNPCQP